MAFTLAQNVPFLKRIIIAIYFISTTACSTVSTKFNTLVEDGSYEEATSFYLENHDKITESKEVSSAGIIGLADSIKSRSDRIFPERDLLVLSRLDSGIPNISEWRSIDRSIDSAFELSSSISQEEQHFIDNNEELFSSLLEKLNYVESERYCDALVEHLPDSLNGYDLVNSPNFFSKYPSCSLDTNRDREYLRARLLRRPIDTASLNLNQLDSYFKKYRHILPVSERNDIQNVYFKKSLKNNVSSSNKLTVKEVISAVSSSTKKVGYSSSSNEYSIFFIENRGIPEIGVKSELGVKIVSESFAGSLISNGKDGVSAYFIPIGFTKDVIRTGSKFVGSKYKSGVRTIENPDWSRAYQDLVAAKSDLREANANYFETKNRIEQNRQVHQSSQFQSQSSANLFLASELLSVSSLSSAESRVRSSEEDVKNSEKKLSITPKTATEDVYTEYNYKEIYQLAEKTISLIGVIKDVATGGFDIYRNPVNWKKKFTFAEGIDRRDHKVRQYTSEEAIGTFFRSNEKVSVKNFLYSSNSWEEVAVNLSPRDVVRVINSMLRE